MIVFKRWIQADNCVFKGFVNGVKVKLGIYEKMMD